ncbi:MAG: O-acetyl-ADP-ribose deacetylase, partial [Mesorhizobium sp.]
FTRQNAVPETVIFCCFDQQTAELYQQALLRLAKGDVHR